MKYATNQENGMFGFKIKKCYIIKVVFGNKNLPIYFREITTVTGSTLIPFK